MREENPHGMVVPEHGEDDRARRAAERTTRWNRLRHQARAASDAPRRSNKYAGHGMDAPDKLDSKAGNTDSGATPYRLPPPPEPPSALDIETDLFEINLLRRAGRRSLGIGAALLVVTPLLFPLLGVLALGAARWLRAP
jgi:hypothetical protein